MQIVTTATALNLTPGIKSAVQEKFGRLFRVLTRFDHSDLLMHVEVARTTHHHHKGKIFRSECRLTLNRKSLYAAVESDDLYNAMDQCVNALKKQIIAFKERQK